VGFGVAHHIIIRIPGSVPTAFIIVVFFFPHLEAASNSKGTLLTPKKEKNLNK